MKSIYTTPSGVDEQIKSAQYEDLHAILRGEISARQTYEQALEKVDSHPESQKLRNLLNDHKFAENFWRKELKMKDEKPESDSGAWGTVAQTVIGAAKVFGETSTLRALKEGEEYGLKQYRDLLESEQISPTLKTKINNVFIPNQKKHIERIDTLMS